MSDTKPSQPQETFTQKLDIHMASTGVYETLLDRCANTPRVVVAAVGPAGIGKTAIPKQVAKRRTAPYLALHMPQMNIEDWHIPTTAADTKVYYDRRIPRKFQQVIEYVARLREENGGKFPKGRNPIISLEELNRTVDKHVTRAAFTLLEDRVIGDVHLDDAIQLVVTMNPSGGGMSVNEFEKDPAMRRRLMMVGVTCSYGDFMRYAKAHKFFPKLVEHLEAQPTLLYDNEAANAGKKFACPAAWETVSQVCYELEASRTPFTSVEARAAFAGIVGATATEAFLEFVQDSTIVITPDEVLKQYREKSQVRERFQKLVQDGRNDKISALSSSVVMKVLEDPKRDFNTYSGQLAAFMNDLPEDAMVAFTRELVEEAKKNGEGQAFLLQLNGHLANDKNFEFAAQRLSRAKEKAAAEAKKSGF